MGLNLGPFRPIPFSTHSPINPTEIWATLLGSDPTRLGFKPVKLSKKRERGRERVCFAEQKWRKRRRKKTKRSTTPVTSHGRISVTRSRATPLSPTTSSPLLSPPLRLALLLLLLRSMPTHGGASTTATPRGGSSRSQSYALTPLI